MSARPFLPHLFLAIAFKQARIYFSPDAGAIAASHPVSRNKR
jgi:hypothetical protein